MSVAEEFGPIRYYRLTRRIAGRAVLSTGVYRLGEILIDTGAPHLLGDLEAALAEPVRHVLLTHHHEDHVGGAAAVARRFGLRPRIHPLGIDLVSRSPLLPLYRRVVWGTPRPVEAEPLGEWFETGRYRFQVIHTPGHAPDHVALYEPTQDWLFVGDLYLGDRVRLAFAYENMTEIIASLRRLLAIPDCVMFCQHTGPHAGHQHRLGRKLDHLLGLQQRAVMHFEEGCSIAEITRRLGIEDRALRWFSRGEFCGRNLVAALLRDAGKLAAPGTPEERPPAAPASSGSGSDGAPGDERDGDSQRLGGGSER